MICQLSASILRGTSPSSTLKHPNQYEKIKRTVKQKLDSTSMNRTHDEFLYSDLGLHIEQGNTFSFQFL